MDGAKRSADEMANIMHSAPWCVCCGRNKTHNGQGICTPCLDRRDQEVRDAATRELAVAE